MMGATSPRRGFEEIALVGRRGRFDQGFKNVEAACDQPLANAEAERARELLYLAHDPQGQIVSAQNDHCRFGEAAPRSDSAPFH